MDVCTGQQLADLDEKCRQKWPQWLVGNYILICREEIWQYFMVKYLWANTGATRAAVAAFVWWNVGYKHGIKEWFALTCKITNLLNSTYRTHRRVLLQRNTDFLFPVFLAIVLPRYAHFMHGCSLQRRAEQSEGTPCLVWFHPANTYSTLPFLPPRFILTTSILPLQLWS